MRLLQSAFLPHHETACVGSGVSFPVPLSVNSNHLLSLFYSRSGGAFWSTDHCYTFTWRYKFGLPTKHLVGSTRGFPIAHSLVIISGMWTAWKGLQPNQAERDSATELFGCLPLSAAGPLKLKKRVRERGGLGRQAGTEFGSSWPTRPLPSFTADA